jgi:biofilm PGA synthesis lipoprotein PgaB
MQDLIRDGALNLAYYPDDFLANKPPYKPTFTGISLNDFPHGQGGH